MSLMKKTMSAAIVLALAAGSQAPLAVSAAAGDWKGRGYGYGQSQHRQSWREPRRDYHYVEPRRNRSGDRIAKGLAIGLGVAVVGAILADQARRDRGYAPPAAEEEYYE